MKKITLLVLAAFMSSLFARGFGTSSNEEVKNLKESGSDVIESAKSKTTKAVNSISKETEYYIADTHGNSSFKTFEELQNYLSVNYSIELSKED